MKLRRFINTAKEAVMVYDNAAIKLRGPNALTNFAIPRSKDDLPKLNILSSGDDSSDDFRSRSSPAFVLRFRSSLTSAEEGEQSHDSSPIASKREDKVCVVDSMLCSDSLDRTKISLLLDYSPVSLPMTADFLDDFFNFEIQEQTLLFDENNNNNCSNFGSGDGFPIDDVLGFGDFNDSPLEEFDFGDLKCEFQGLFKDSFQDQLPHSYGDVKCSIQEEFAWVQNKLELGDFNHSSLQEFFDDFDVLIPELSLVRANEDFSQENIFDMFANETT